MTTMERRRGMGALGHCMCPRCGLRVPHRPGIRCGEERCPTCGVTMLREGSEHHRLWLAKHGTTAGRPPPEPDDGGDHMTAPTTTRAATGERDAVADGLARLLADTYTLYLKTHGYHWNVTGPQFRSLHLMFEEQYVELQVAVDELAERIRTLGPLAPGSYREMASLTRLTEDEGAPPAVEMVRRLEADNAAVTSTARDVLTSAEAAADAATVDLATRRIAVHEKAGWMLRATRE